MADDLLDLDVWVLFGRIVIEYGFKFGDEEIVFFGYLDIGENNVVGIVGPCVVSCIVEAVCLAREVNSLVDDF